MYPYPNHHHPEGSYSGGHLRADACWCATLPALTPSLIQFFLLIHERELSRPTNTGHLVMQAITNTRQAVWARRQPPLDLINDIQSGRLVYLVFPAEWAQAPAIATLPDSQVLLVLLDATWQEARKIYRQSSYLQSLPVLSLMPTYPSTFTLRRHQRPGHLSTAEVVTHILAQYGDTAQTSVFNTYYEQFLTHYKASRYGHNLPLQDERS